MKALHGRIFVKPTPTNEKKTETGIIIPSDKWNVHIEGIIVECSEGRLNSEGKLIKSEVKKGDVVLYTRNEFYPKIQIGKVECQAITEHDIICVME